MRNLLAIAVLIAGGPALAQTVTQGYYVPIGQYYVSWAYPTINLAAAQSRGLTGKGVTVAVFDTGLNTASYKFAGNLAGPRYNRRQRPWYFREQHHRSQHYHAGFSHDHVRCGTTGQDTAHPSHGQHWVRVMVRCSAGQRHQLCYQ